MITEQLHAARIAHWRQKQNPILTLEDAQSWIEQHPLALFLPRKAQLPAPAPSFVEAVLGEANATPPPAAIEQARELLIRLIQSGHAVALNLLGELGEQPDFVAQTEILPFAVAFRGERDWKQPPGKAGGPKVSPLIVDLWEVLESKGPLTASAAREQLGRELTEAAVMRALGELWQTLRVLPALQPEGQPALWALTQHHHRAALAKASSTSQVTAISLLVSMYLQSVYAATNEEIEIFLSPLVSRSRIREAVRGLAATRQIQSLSMDAQTYYFLEGGLPEFAAAPEPERVEPVRRRSESSVQRPDRGGARPPVRPPVRTGGRSLHPRSNDPRSNRPAAGRSGERPQGDWKRKPAAAGAGSGPPAAKWRKFPQAEKNAPGQRRRTEGYPSSRPNPPDRPSRPQGGSPERREGGPPWKKPRWDRNRTVGAPFNPQRENTARRSSGQERSSGGASRFARPGSRPFSTPGSGPSSGFGSPPGSPPVSRPRQPQGFSPPKRRSSAPHPPANDERRPAAPGFSKPRGFAKSTTRAGMSGKPPGRPSQAAGNRTAGGGRTGGYKSAGYRAGRPKSDAAKEGSSKKGSSGKGGSKMKNRGKENRGPGNFRPRGFDSRPRPGRPKSSTNPASPKRGFRDRNLGKKKPEA